MTDDPNAWLMGAGVPAAKFPRQQYGTTVKGTIRAIERTQQTDFATKKPLFYDDGKPRWQLVVTLQTDERDPSREGDDGVRKLYVKGQMTKAVRDAVVAAGAEGLAVGGTLAVRYVSDRPSDKGEPAKVYVAQYVPPQASVDLLGPQTAPAPASGQVGTFTVSTGAATAPIAETAAATDLI